VDRKIGPSSVGGVALVLGGVLLAAGNTLLIATLHGSGGARDIDAYARAVTEGVGPWHLAHAMLIAAPLLWGLGLLVLYGVLSAQGERFFSLAGLLAIFVAIGLHVFSATEGGFLIPLLAQSYLSSTSDAALRILEYGRLLSLTVAALAILLEIAGTGLFGAALLRVGLHPWLGLTGTAVGLSGVLGYASGIFDPYWIFGPLFLPLGAAASVWLVAAGVALLRNYRGVFVKDEPAHERM
jgi:hypothetical protein